MANSQNQGGKNSGPQIFISYGPSGHQIIFNATPVPTGAAQPVAALQNTSGKTVSATGQIANSSVVFVNPA